MIASIGSACAGSLMGKRMGKNISTRERPITFSGPEVVAILDGRKTQTRRVITTPIWHVDRELDDDGWPVFEDPDMPSTWLRLPCPHGAVGDRLWVREAWKYYGWTEDGEPFIQYRADDRIEKRFPVEDWIERIDCIWASLSRPENYDIDRAARDRAWRSSIHMPRWASRILLEISEVRVQRLQEISCADAIAEGVRPAANSLTIDCDTPDPRKEFSNIWDSVNGKRPNTAWANNSFCWATTFRRLKP